MGACCSNLVVDRSIYNPRDTRRRWNRERNDWDYVFGDKNGHFPREYYNWEICPDPNPPRFDENELGNLLPLMEPAFRAHPTVDKQKLIRALFRLDQRILLYLKNLFWQQSQEQLPGQYTTLLRITWLFASEPERYHDYQNAQYTLDNQVIWSQNAATHEGNSILVLPDTVDGNLTNAGSDIFDQILP